MGAWSCSGICFPEYKHAGWDALPAPDEVPEVAEKDVAHLSEILSVFGEFSAKHLERMTHHEDPWLEARGDILPEARSNAVISKERMMDYYRGLYEKAADDE